MREEFLCALTGGTVIYLSFLKSQSQSHLNDVKRCCRKGGKNLKRQSTAEGKALGKDGRGEIRVGGGALHFGSKIIVSGSHYAHFAQ